MNGGLNLSLRFLSTSLAVCALLLCCPLFLGLVSPVAAESGMPRKSKLIKSVKKSIDDIGVPGVVLAVGQSGRRPVIVSAGLAEIEEQETDQNLLSSLKKKGLETEGLLPETLLPSLSAATIIRGKQMTADRKFRIASLEKTFVAATVLLLAGEGVLGLDDPVEKWVKSSDLPLKGVRIRHLLTHRSGVPNYTEHPEFYSELLKEPVRKRTPRELLDYARFREAYFRPDEDARYSNTNYVLLGMIVEKAAGRPYANEVRDRIIAPLGLKNTLFPESPEIADDFSRGYRHDFRASGRWRDYSTFVDPSWAWGHGRLVSNAEDLTAFMAELFGGRLLGEDLTREMMNFGTRTGDGPEYGMGVKKWKGGIGHDGDYVFGYQSLMLRHRGLGWVVLINGQPTRIGLLNGPMDIWRQVTADLGME